MNSLRLSNLSIPIAALALLVAGAANAATYSMTGKAATGSGAFVDLPALGNAACPSITGKIGFASMAKQPTTFPSKWIGPVPHNPGGCIPGGPAKVATTAMGGFSVPVGFFKQDFPGGPLGGTPADLNVTPVPNIGQILQLASSFKFTGPVSSAVTTTMTMPHNWGPWFEKKNPVVKSKAYAPWRKIQPTAWDSQTGRAGLNFVACGGTVMHLACTVPSQGAVPAIIKNYGGSNPGGGGFGGTMGLVLTTSPTQSSSLVVKVGAAQTVLLNIVGGKGSRAAGRGYAAYDTDVLAAGPLFLMYKLTTANTPMYAVVAMVSTPIGLGPTGVNKNWGFPFTTGDIVVRGTGSTNKKGIAGQTVTAMGTDKATTMIGLTKGMASVMVPGGRLIQLVAGGVAQSNIQGPNGTPNYTVVRLPEPGRAMQLLAGAAGLIAIAVWRARKIR
jgi:hypothetical protein